MLRPAFTTEKQRVDRLHKERQLQRGEPIVAAALRAAFRNLEVPDVRTWLTNIVRTSLTHDIIE